MGQHLSDAPRDVANLIFDLGGHYTRFSAILVFVLHLCTKFEIRRPSPSEDMTHFRSQQQLNWWPWPLTLKLVRVIASGVGGQPSCQFWCFYDVSFSTYRPTPVRRITWPCDLDLWPCRSWRLSVKRVFILHLCTKFQARSLVGLSIRKIWRTFFLSISRPSELDLWPWN